MITDDSGNQMLMSQRYIYVLDAPFVLFAKLSAALYVAVLERHCLE